VYSRFMNGEQGEIFDAKPVAGKPNEFAVVGVVSESSPKVLSAKERWQKHEVVTVENERSKTLASPEMQGKLSRFESDITRAVTETTPRPAAHFSTDDFDQRATEEQSKIAEQVYQARVKDRIDQLLGRQSIEENEITNIVENRENRKINRADDGDRKLLYAAEKEFESTRIDYHEAKELAQKQAKQLPQNT